MDSLLSMLAVTAICMAGLMAYIVIARAPKQSLRSAFVECLTWGIGGFVSFAAEILVVWELVW